MSLLLATIASGEAIDYGHITVPRMYDYARKVGADLKVITQPTLGEVFDCSLGGNGGPSWWKLPLIEWFSKQYCYDWMAFVDIDVFIPKAASDIFKSNWHHGQIGIHMSPDMNDDRELPLWENWRKEKYPSIQLMQEAEHYMNAGVWMLDFGTAQRIRIASEGKDLHSRWQDQDFLNLMAYHTGSMMVMNRKFNQPIPFKSKDVSDKTGFWHLCGMPQNSKLEWLQRMDKADRNGWPTI